jgi:hypothetical protein
MVIKGKKHLTDDINGSIYMSDGSRQQCPEGRAAQSCPHPFTAVPTLARGRPTTGKELLDIGAPGLSLPRAGTATQAPGPGRRGQSVLHRQAFAQSCRPTPRLRRFDRIDLKRDRQPCLLGGTEPRARSWLTERRVNHEPCIWNIASIDCCRTSWFKPMNCSCQTGAGRRIQTSSPQTARRF